MANFQWLFKEKSFDGIETGSMDWFNRQQEIILSRPLLRANYDLWYAKVMADEKSVPKNEPGKILEIGSGGGYVKTLYPDVITSDVMPGVADIVLDARSLPFPDQSLRAIILTNSFHHIPDVETFLKEAVRTLVPHGVISMIDPAATPLARIFFTNFHPEPFLPKRKEWTFDSTHNMDSSNQALSWIVFKRDEQRFKALFPNLSVEKFTHLPWLSYLATGGVTRRNMIPSFAVPLFKMIDSAISPLNGLASLNWHITIRKNGT